MCRTNAASHAVAASLPYFFLLFHKGMKLICNVDLFHSTYTHCRHLANEDVENFPEEGV